MNDLYSRWSCNLLVRGLYLMVTMLVHTKTFAVDPSDELLWRSEKNISLRAFKGKDARQYFHETALLRIEMFKEFPYLYEGSFDYEREYLETYFKSENSVILLVFDGDTVVGFSNIIPVSEEMKEIQQAFHEQEIDTRSYLYIGEVMIKSPYRGQGLLRKFFEYHENFAKKFHYDHLVFMTVKRPADHPHRPKDYSPLEPIWEHFGFYRLPGANIKLAWKQTDTASIEENDLEIWRKAVH